MTLSEEYLTLEFFKSIVKSTDTQDDVQYQDFVDNSNRKVSAAIFRYVNLPLDDQSDEFESASDAALAYARYLLSIDIELVEKAKTYMEFYNIELFGEGGTEAIPMAGGLIQKLIASRTPRTETVLAVFDPREHKVILPAQLDLAATERFQ